MKSLEDLSDAELLDAFCTAGSDAALALLAERHRPLVFGVAFGFTREQERARVATDEVFRRLAQDASAIRGRVSLADWLRRVAEDVCDPEPRHP